MQGAPATDGIPLPHDVASLRVGPQGAEGYQLTWMDARVQDWVVTPRRGKAVEINALWYNALCLLAAWIREESGDQVRAETLADQAHRARESFDRRFWYEPGVGSISEIFDAEPPFTPRGCIAQARSVAEALRCWVKTSDTRGTQAR